MPSAEALEILSLETKRKEAFSIRFRRLLQRTGASQSEFARRAGINRDRVSKYISGQQLPGARTLADMLEAFKHFGVEVVYEDLMPDTASLRSAMRAGVVVEEVETWAERNREANMPIPSMAFEFFDNGTGRVKLNKVLPVDVIHQIIDLVAKVDAANAARGGGPLASDTSESLAASQ